MKEIIDNSGGIAMIPPTDDKVEGFWDRWNRAAYRRRADTLREILVRDVYTAKRNEPCSCGSGVKFKKCHYLKLNNNIIDMSLMMTEHGLTHEYVWTAEEIERKGDLID